MTAFPTITADTPVNDAALLDGLITDLDERRLALYGVAPAEDPKNEVWFTWPLDPAYTVVGVYDEETDTTELSTTRGFGLTIGRRVTITGIGTFTIIEAYSGRAIVQGDATCAGATWKIAPAGNVIDAHFWATLQGIATVLVPYYLNSFAHPDGFAGEAAPEFFAVDSEDFLAATGLAEGLWRRVRARGPCSLTYDAESDTTTIVDGGASPDFVAGHVGHLVDVFGVGQFVVATVEDASTITVAGDAARGHPDTVVSVLPDDPMGQDDAAFDRWGACEAGDVLGPWLLFDLIAAMGAMKWTVAVSAFGTGIEGQDGMGDDDDLAHAKADAEAAFAADEPGGSNYVQATAVTEPGQYDWRGTLARSAGYGFWEVPDVPPGGAPLIYDIDLYAVASRAGMLNVFNGNGDFEAEDEDVMKLFDSVADCADRYGQGETLLGDHSVAPAWPGSDPSGSGYFVMAYYGVVKWHFAHEA
jgi:hypothetical protein